MSVHYQTYVRLLIPFLVWAWKYHFKDVIEPTIKFTLAAKPPNYKKILELDRKVRDMAVPDAFNSKNTAVDEQSISREQLLGGMLSQHRTVVLLFLHKSFFVQALLDNPENPLLSRYAPSFLATSSCASTVVKMSIALYSKMPQLYLRLVFDLHSQYFNSNCLFQMVDDVD